MKTTPQTTQSLKGKKQTNGEKCSSHRDQGSKETREKIWSREEVFNNVTTRAS